MHLYTPEAQPMPVAGRSWARLSSNWEPDVWDSCRCLELVSLEVLMHYLLILNDPPHGTERRYNGLRQAGSLA